MSYRRQASGALDMGGLTPLLDTVFLLLFALLALSRNADTTELVRVDLPVVDPEGEAAPGDELRLVLVVDEASVIRLAPEDPEARTEAEPGRVIATREDLDVALADALRTRFAGRLPEEITIEIQADAASRHGVSVELLQHLRLAGFQRVELLATGSTRGAGAFGTTTEGER